MCTGMYTGMCAGMVAGMFTDMCIGTYMSMCRGPVYKPVYEHGYRHLCRHACGQVHGEPSGDTYICMHRCVHIYMHKTCAQSSAGVSLSECVYRAVGCLTSVPVLTFLTRADGGTVTVELRDVVLRFVTIHAETMAIARPLDSKRKEWGRESERRKRECACRSLGDLWP